MPKKLDSLDLRIIDNLAIHSPRNISRVARKLGIPSETLRKRLKRLSSHFYLRININVYHTNLGLKKAVVFVNAAPGYENLILDFLRSNDFWIYVSRCYGAFEGCLAIYTVPKENCSEFEKFISKLQELNIARNVRVFWSTCFQTVQSRRTWFNHDSKDWIFQWHEWLKEIPEESTNLPKTLVDPEDFPTMGDEIDLFILKELEKDATRELTKIAQMLGASQQLIGYHYNRHLISRGLIESYVVTFKQFDMKASDMFFFVLQFDGNDKLAKFANSLMDKPFVLGMGKVLGQESLIVYFYLPRREFRKLIEALSKLARSGFLQSYDYVIQDLEKASRETIPYQCFKDGKWIYDHDKYMGNLENLVRKVKIARSGVIGKYA